MFNNVSPEKIGIESKFVKNFLYHIEDCGFNTHNVLLMRGTDIFCEAYWKPFNKDFLHRQYSQTKSYVGIAIMLLLEEGKLKLTDKIADYFRDKIDKELPEFFEEQTIEDMLTMSTAVAACSWFLHEDRDRVHNYFNHSAVVRPSATTNQYDSAGSQVLCALVERLAKMPLLDYLKQKLFNKMGTFKNAYILKTPSGESWGDSALICTPRDMLSFARLLLNGGAWNGEQLINGDYVKKATSAVVSNAYDGHNDTHNNHGYGYQIWRLEGGAFAFVGMGWQLTLCYPKEDLIFVYNSDNQGAHYTWDILAKFLKYDILENLQDSALPENPSQQQELLNYISGLELRALNARKTAPIKEQINGKKFIAVGDNAQGIKEFSLHFDGEDCGRFCYENAQGKKELPFGINKNVFAKFPQLGYSNEVGGEPTNDGFMYDCATSLTFYSDRQLAIYCQIIDKYLGNLSIVIGFNKGYATVKMSKTAEFFLMEYLGDFVAKME